MVGVKTYGDDYPDSVAGHVAHDALNADNEPAVNTTHGVDWGFSGDDIAKETDDEYEGVGQENVARKIGGLADEANGLRMPYPTLDVADHCTMGNLTFAGTDSINILRRNLRRRLVTLTNQGASLLLVSNQKIVYPQGVSVTLLPPNVVYLPAGAARDLRYRGPVFIMAPTGAGTVDWIEETY